MQAVCDKPRFFPSGRHSRVSLGAVRKGMNLAKVFSRKETFLAAHAPTAAPAA